MTDFALKVKGLTKTYPGNIEALKCIDLEVKSGDFYALLGPNGAGKSTAIGVISSLVTKSSGKVEVLGIDIDENHSRAKRKLGVVGQEVNFAQFEENSEYFLKRLGLWDKRNEQGRNLSGGMKRRLMVAKALVNKPDLLILDEPTAGVDIELRRSLWDFLKEINDNGTTIILTTHYLEEAEKLCKNISIIDRGKIVKSSSMRSLLKELESETYVFELKKPIKSDFNNNFNFLKLSESSLSVQIDEKNNLNDILKFFSSNDIEILSMTNETNKLEELFLSLTN